MAKSKRTDEIILKEVVFQEKSKDETFQNLMFITDYAKIQARYYKPENAKSALICVGGCGGGFDSPANALYPKLGEEFSLKSQISTLRIKFRNPTRLEEAVYDVLTGIHFLKNNEKIEKIALMGHSFGGAVVIQAGSISKQVSTVVTLSSQSYGATSAVKGLPQDCSILCVHGSEDPVLPEYCSREIHAKAHEPKELSILPNNTHCLEESADLVKVRVSNWILKELA